MIIDVVKVFIPAVVSFIIGITVTPIFTAYLYKHRMWKKQGGKVAPDGKSTPIFNTLHKDREVGTPKMGGIIIWFSAAATTVIFWLLAELSPGGIFTKLDFLSRNQTWLPLFALIQGGLVGLIDDFLEIKGGGDHIAGGLSLRKRLAVVSLIGLAAALWFYFKLDVHTIGLPFVGDIEVSFLFIPIFILVMLAIYSGGVIDGIDGLAGGIFAGIFAAYSVIAFYQNQIDLAAFGAVIVGAILAFLWFNIPPARFYMSETGTMSLTIVLGIFAFMTDSLGDGHGIVALPIIALPLVLTSLSVILQLTSKKLRHGKKVFLVAPLHHHFEAKGWPPYKVVMRFWVIGVIFAVMGVVLALIG